jgi:PAS domain S-box-containing protein
VIERPSWSVLIVDDDPEDVLIMRDLLAKTQRDRFEVQSADSYAVGLEKLLAGHFDAALIDYRLGGHTGTDLIRAAQVAGCRTPLVLCTGYGSYEINLDAVQAGAVDTLPKDDLNSTVLERILRYAIERQRAADRLVESEERYRLAVEAFQGMVYDLDLVTGRSLRSAGLFDLLGFSPDELDADVGGWLQRVHPEDEPVVRHQLQRALASDRTLHESEYRVRHRDGRWLNVWDRARIVRDAGKAIRVVGTVTDMTVRRQLEDAVARSERRHRQLLSSTFDGVWSINANWQTETINEAGARMLGYRPEEMIAQPVAQFVMPEALSSAFQTVEWMRTGSGGVIEVAARHRDGYPMTLEMSATALLDERGQFGGALAVFNDISLRKRIERHSRFVNELGRDLLPLTEPDAAGQLVVERVRAYFEADVCLLDENSLERGYLNVLYRSSDQAGFPRATALSEFSPAVLEKLLAGEKVGVANTQTDPLTRDHYARVFAPAGILSFAIAPRLIHGRWLGSLGMLCHEPHPWQPDELSLLRSLADLAWLALENTRAMQRVRESEERFRIALANKPITVFTTDRELRYTWFHSPMVEQHPEFLLGKTDEEVLGKEAAAEMMAVKRAVVETGQTRRDEVRFSMVGTPRVFDLTTAPLLDASGKTVGITGAGIDITELRELEAEHLRRLTQLEVQRRLMEHREQERLQLARDLHDGPLQDLLAVNVGIANALNAENRALLLERMEGVQAALAQQIGEIRRFCHELRPPTLAPYGLEKAIRSHASSFRERYPDLTVNLTLDRDQQALPETTRMALFRVYQELMNNASRHAQASHVEVRLAVEDEAVTLTVSDDGQGFRPPADWMELARSGHLGLLGVRERVDAIGGKLEIRSAPGAGTQVTVRVARG